MKWKEMRERESGQVKHKTENVEIWLYEAMNWKWL